MTNFTISAHQEMYADEQIEAGTLLEAVNKFKDRLRNGQVVWSPSDEEMDFSVSEQDETGNTIREADGEALDISLRA